MTNLPIVYSGIHDRLSAEDFSRKLNFLDPNDARNLNASFTNCTAGLNTAAQNGYGGFGAIMPAKVALLGSPTVDWGSAKFGSLLNCSDPNWETNFLDITNQRPGSGINHFAALQLVIGEIARRYRGEIPESVQKILEYFKPLLEALNQTPFNKKDFTKKYDEFCVKYKSEDKLFQKEVIQPIITEINKILENQAPTSDDEIKIKIKEQLGKHFDVALRVVNGTDKYNSTYGFPRYNEVHVPPLLQFIKGFFIIDDGAYNYIEKKLEIYKTIKDVREILFLPPEHHKEENFNQLTTKQKESFKRFFCIKDKELNFELYQKTIDTFFENQTRYVKGIIKNLNNCNQEELKTEEKYFNELTPEKKESFKTFFGINPDQQLTFSLYQQTIETFFKNQKEKELKTEEKYFNELTPEKKESFKTFFCIIQNEELNFEVYKENIEKFFKNQKEKELKTEEINKLISRYSDSIDRTKLPELLSKPFLLQLLDSQSQTLKTQQQLIEEIQPCSTEPQKQKSALFYLGLGVLDSAEYKKLNFKELDINKLIENEPENRIKIIIAGALEAVDVDNFEKLCGLVGNNVNHKHEIIITALEKKAIKDLTVENLKGLCGLFEGDVNYKYGIIITALEKKAITDFDFDKLNELCRLFGDRKLVQYRIIITALEKKAITDFDFDFDKLNKLCGLFEDVAYKHEIIIKALKTKAIKDYSEEKLKKIIMPSRLTRVTSCIQALFVRNAHR